MNTLFDPIRVPLEMGTTLIEASAGTGKTYSLAALFLRFVLEEGVPVQSLLAVTFSKAATRELKERIRTRLRVALEAIHGDPAAEPVVKRYLEDGGDPREAARRLELALHSFDEAPIFTIHGFCQRMLGEHAFESGARYEAGEPLPDAGALFAEGVADFWRTLFYDASPLIAALAAGGFLGTPALLCQVLEQQRPGVVLLPEAEPVPPERLRADLDAAFAPLPDAWAACGKEVASLLLESPALRRKQTNPYRPEELGRHFAALDRMAAGALPDVAILEALDAVSAGSVAANLKANKAAPEHPFLTASEAFRREVERFRTQLPHAALAAVGALLEERKLRSRVLTFDDLLTRLHDALEGSEGDRLAREISSRYAVALLDEFQDTDPLQATIFRKLFAGGAHWLYLIGDPKQAIYGFRGADLFAYLAAARAADRAYHLPVNWRSGVRLVAGLNALFQQVDAPFVLDGVSYYPVEAAPGRTPENAPPLHFREVAMEERTFAQAVEPIAAAVARDISHLCAAGHSPAEMAVLVRTGRQARLMQEALRRAGIPSVRQTEENVFQAPEAAALQRLLAALLEPRREGVLRAALLAPLLAVPVERVAALEHDEAARLVWLERFAEWHALWGKEGVMAVLRRVLVETGVRQRLVAEPGGERALTNFLHLAELLHTEETTRRLAPESLFAWFWQQRQGSERKEEAQLRLESDAAAVEIVTVHRSKGLEYRLVFCPCLLAPAVNERKRSFLHFHNDEGVACLDLRAEEAPEAHRNASDREQLAEELRLLYVAVTRACEALYIYTAPTKNAEASPLAHLFPGGDVEGGIRRLARAVPESVTVEPAAETVAPVPRPANETERAARLFRGRLEWRPFTTSFTGLTAGTGHEEPERDLPVEETELPVVEPAEPHGIFAFPKGAAAGDFFHDVLEQLDFRAPETLGPLVADRLTRHGFARLPLADAVVAALRETLAVELAPGLRLAEIARADRLSEATFFCPLASLAPRDLRELGLEADEALTALGGREWGRLQFAPVHGYLRGAIDLLFTHGGRYYLVDWKSNWLGNRPGDYDAPGVTRAMRQHHYALQAWLYVLAADRFLHQRLPGYDYETHFGGVFYLFLRGIDARHPERGICRLRPTLAQVERLRRFTEPFSPLSPA